MATQQDVLVSQLSELFKKLGLDKNGDGCEALGRAIKDETQRLEERHGLRLGRLEEQLNRTRIDVAEAEGRIDTVQTGMDGQAKLFFEMLSRLNEKVERIESNTSKEQSARRARFIALTAAIPGVVSVILRVIEMASG